MTDELDKLKQQWQQMQQRCDVLEDYNQQLSERLKGLRVTSLQESLARSIRRMGLMGLLLPLLAPSMVTVLGLPWWYSSLYAVFGAILSALNLWLANYIMKEKLPEMPVARALARSAKIKSLQFNLRIGSIIGGIIVIGLGAFAMPEENMKIDLLIAAIIGAAIGLSIGIPKGLAIARKARELKECFS